jgi:PAS domain S-box-containing protein
MMDVAEVDHSVTIALVLLGILVLGCVLAPLFVRWRLDQSRKAEQRRRAAHPLWSRATDTALPKVWSEHILESTHDAIILWEMDGRGIVFWNHAAELLYGFSREEAYGRVTHELLKTELTGGVDELETRLARYGVWVGDLCHTCADGRRVEIEGRLSILSRGEGPSLVLEVNRDVTDRNRAEAGRRAMEAQLRRLHAHFTD